MPSLSDLLDAMPYSALTLCRCKNGWQVAWQASTPTEASAWRIREATTPSEAIRLILGAPAERTLVPTLPPPPY